MEHASATLLSREETTREIHDRVKNNLQTIASLLRLQARRLGSPEAKEALAQSVRRIRVMALVHETLAAEKGNTVPFAEVLRGLVRLVEDGRTGAQHPIRFDVEGDLGNLAPEVATPLLSAISELLDNAARHAFPAEPPGNAEPTVIVHLARQGTEAVINVWDNGIGLPAGFCPETTAGLGLSIVQSFVISELGGTLCMQSADGTWVQLQVPLHPAS